MYLFSSLGLKKLQKVRNAEGCYQVAVEFCAERREAAAGREGKYVIVDISSPEKQTVVCFRQILLLLTWVPTAHNRKWDIMTDTPK